jgi:hypothetical protein
MQFSIGMSQLDSDKKRRPIAVSNEWPQFARGRMPPAPVMAATGKEHDVSLQA